MTVRIYRSTDASAPVLTGQTGSLVALLDAVLVNGYGSLTAAGWTIGFTTTSKRAYLQNLTGANNASGMYLYVDDSGPGAGTFKEARACGFETMSAITPTGTGQFPTSAQSAVGVGTLVIRKSTTADATARAWTVVANGQTVYIFVETGDQVTPVAAFPFVFGDFFSYKTSDSYAVCIIGRTAENSGSANIDWMEQINVPKINVLMTLASAMEGHFAARSWTGVGGSVRIGKSIDIGKHGYGDFNTSGIPWITGSWAGTATGSTAKDGSASVGMGRNLNTSYFPYPNGPDGSCWVSPVWVNHNSSVRGYLKGLWAPLHDRPLNHSDTYTVSGGNLNGKSLVAQQIPCWISGVVDVAQIHIETSDTWA